MKRKPKERAKWEMENWNQGVKSGRLESENEAMESWKAKWNITGTQSDQKISIEKN